LSLLQNQIADIGEWDTKLLAPLALVMNTSTNASIKMTPFKATFGIEARTGEMWAQPESTGVPSVDEFQKDLHDIFMLCKSATEEASRLSLEAANLHRREEIFNIGDQVWLSTKNMSKIHLEFSLTQLRQKYIGPFVVSGIKGSEKKIIKLNFSTNPEHRLLHRYVSPWFVSERLKKDLGAPDPEPEVRAVPVPVPTPAVITQPPIEVEDNIADDDLYALDDVLEERVSATSGRKEYLISFVGYGAESNLWLPITALNPEARKVVREKFPVKKISKEKQVKKSSLEKVLPVEPVLGVRRSTRERKPPS
jgi:hypothetical protein